MWPGLIRTTRSNGVTSLAAHSSRFPPLPRQQVVYLLSLWRQNDVSSDMLKWRQMTSLWLATWIKYTLRSFSTRSFLRAPLTVFTCTMHLRELNVHAGSKWKKLKGKKGKYFSTCRQHASTCRGAIAPPFGRSNRRCRPKSSSMKIYLEEEESLHRAKHPTNIFTYQSRSRQQPPRKSHQPVGPSRSVGRGRVQRTPKWSTTRIARARE